jgi:hypothetical protein
MSSTATVIYIKIFRTVVILGMLLGFGFFSNFFLPKDDIRKKRRIEAGVSIFFALLVLITPVSWVVSFLDANFASRHRSASGGFSVDVPFTWNIVTADAARDLDSAGIPEGAVTHLRAGFRVISRGYRRRGRPHTVSYANMRVDRADAPASSSPYELIADLNARLDKRKESVSAVSGLLDYALPDMAGGAQSAVENVQGHFWARTARTANIPNNRARTFIYYQTVNPGNGLLYIVTFSTDHPRQYLSIFRKVMRSFDFM